MLTRERVSETIRNLIPTDHVYLEVVWGIEDFNRKFEVKPNLPMQIDLIHEETIEWVMELYECGASANLLKETIDIIYVLEGLLAMHVESGELPINEVYSQKLYYCLNLIDTLIAPHTNFLYSDHQIKSAFLEVQESNMSKLGEDGKPIRREDGKVLKGPNYFKADVSVYAPDAKSVVEYAALT